PSPLTELLPRREHKERLREPGPEHEVHGPALPRPRAAPACEDPHEYHRAGDGQHRAQQHDAPHGELARLLDQHLTGKGGGRAHRRPPALAAFASACRVRTYFTSSHRAVPRTFSPTT